MTESQRQLPCEESDSPTGNRPILGNTLYFRTQV